MQTVIVILGLLLALLAFVHAALHLNDAGGAVPEKTAGKSKPGL